MKNYMKLWAIGSFAAIALWSGCDLINPDEETPAYLYVTGFELTTDAALEGSNSHKITDVWLSVDGNFLGVYSLPALIPVLETGQHVLTLDAGMKDNGINATPEIYPFYESYEITVDLKANETDTIRPATQYRANTKFAFIEPFETAQHQFRDVRRPEGATGLQISMEDVFEGQSSALITLDTAKQFLELATINEYRDLLKTGAYVYLEVNYKSEVPVIFGVIGHLDGGGIGGTSTLFDPGFLPKDEWNKIYFNLTEMIFDGDFDSYQIVFQAFIPSENDKPTLNNAKVWLDNIKLVHF
ncbi:MAG: hypothetical protein ACKV1O_11690 [Saprospiraceae bacterium]